MAVESTRSVLSGLGDPREEARVGPADAKAYELAERGTAWVGTLVFAVVVSTTGEVPVTVTVSATVATLNDRSSGTVAPTWK